MEEIKIIGDVLKIGVLYSPIIFSNGLTSTPKEFYEQAREETAHLAALKSKKYEYIS
jgi:hypothetical protein